MHALKYNTEVTQPSQRTIIPHIAARSCHDITRRSHSNFALSFKLLPSDKANALEKFYAFCRIADDCVDELDQPQDQLQALAFWQERVQKMFAGTPDHAITAELKPIVEHYKIPQNYFMSLIAGCRMDITRKHYDTMDELYDYCYHVAGVVGLVCLKIFEYESPTAEKMAIDLGIAFQLTNIIRDVRDDLNRGRIYLPSEEMKRFCYTKEDLLSGVQNAAFFAMMKAFCLKITLYYQTAFDEFKRDTNGKLIAAKAMTRIYHRLLKKIICQGFPVLKKKVRLGPIEKMLLLLQIYRDKKS